MPSDFLNSPAIHSTSAESKSSPPKCPSPFVELTSIVVPDSSSTNISNIEISNVPPPRSYTATFSSFFLFLSRPYAKAAAVGSLIILLTSNPAIFPASFVAFL